MVSEENADIKECLAKEGISVYFESDPDECVRIVRQHRPDIVLVDLDCGSSMELVERLLRSKSGLEIFALTRGNSCDREAIIDSIMKLGGNVVCMGLPIVWDELIARIRAAFRRLDPCLAQPDNTIRIGCLEIDLEGHLVRKNGDPVKLTQTEWEILAALASNPGQVMLARDLLTTVWGPECWDNLPYLRRWISQLRKKIEENPSNPRLIHTRTGEGYKLAAA